MQAAVVILRATIKSILRRPDAVDFNKLIGEAALDETSPEALRWKDPAQ